VSGANVPQSLLESLLTRSTKRRPHEREIVLGQRRIFILPTRAGAVFAAILTLMLAGSINYGLGLGLVLTFLLGSFGVTAIFHTFRNLAGLRVTPIRAQAVFAGETAHFGIGIHNPTRAWRYAIRLARARLEADIVDVPGESSAILTLRVAARERGVLRPGRLTLHTRFPVGLYHAWSYLDLDAQCIVYPKPAPPGMPFPPAATRSAAGARAGAEADDFAGFRSYRPGDRLRHIAWKAAARGQGMLTKQFDGAHGGEVWLSLDLLPERLDMESRISQLARWVIDAHAAGLAYGLRLPDAIVRAASGERHRDRCLEALALLPPARSAAAAGRS
jgi:uncharacterized protein (DUF58 family)